MRAAPQPSKTDRSAQRRYLSGLFEGLSPITGAASLASMALRTNSELARELLALGATNGRLGYSDLTSLALPLAGPEQEPPFSSPLESPNMDWLLQCATVAALGGGSSADRLLGMCLFELAWNIEGPSSFDRDSATLFVQLLASLRRYERLTEVAHSVEIHPTSCWAVELDALSPFEDEGGSSAAWLESLNAQFAGEELERIWLAGEHEPPFTRLAATPDQKVYGTELVTVIMPAYCPTSSIYNSVRSILAQSWTNLELLVVDDGSPHAYQPVFDQIASLDPRLRVITASSNRGTYVARNLGMEQARGEFITFQDTDDWSHPRRIERQLEPLRDNPGLLATRSRALRAFPDLRFTYPGYPPDRINASSLLFRREPVMRLVGYHDEVRKSGDVEFTGRLTASADGCLLDLKHRAPLAITQLARNSLSRGDARPGWIDWARIAYRDAFELWHSQIRERKARPFIRRPQVVRTFPLPDPSWAPDHEVSGPGGTYDVVFLNDWRSSLSYTHPLDEIRILAESGRRLAVAHVETPFPPTRVRERLAPPLQEMINAGTVDLIHPSQRHAVDWAIAADPAVLQFLPAQAGGLRPGGLLALTKLPEDPQWLGSGADSDIRYRVADCIQHAEEILGCSPTWVPRDSRTRAYLGTTTAFDAIAPLDLPEGFRPATFETSSLRPDPRRPILGRHLPDYWWHWPSTPEELLSTYPDTDGFDVRLSGRASTPLSILGRPTLPPNWITYPRNALSPREFLGLLDFFVYFPHPNASIVNYRATMEALASGCVAILPQRFEPILGEAALYCDACDAWALLTELQRDKEQFQEQQERGWAYLEVQDYPGTFLNRLGKLMEGRLIGVPA